jgi:hypothetical protein
MKLGHIVAKFAFVALVARGVVPAGWMPSDESAAPLTPCSLSQISDRSDNDRRIEQDGAPDQRDAKGHDNFCALGTSPGVAQPDHTIFYTPVLQDHDDLEDDTVLPVRNLHHGAPQAPRASAHLPLV